MRELAFAAPKDGIFPESTYLQIEKSAVVRARIIMDCALIEEVTALMIMNYILSDSPKWNKIEYFGRIKRYRLFFDEVLARLTSRNKINVVKKFTKIPRRLAETLQRMFALRDMLAHVCTFDYSDKRALQYKGKNILSLDGFQSYIEDSNKLIVSLMEKARVV
jgi:hypothetical protein